MKRELRIALLVLLLSAVGMGKGYADVIIGDLIYYLSQSSTKTATVLGHKDGQSATGELTIPSMVTFNGISYSVNRIEDDAFKGCSGLTGNLIIPESVQYIEKSAFYGCSGFTGDLYIGRKVIQIDEDAFNGCSGFSGVLTIELGRSYYGTNHFYCIGNRVFKNCSGFSEVLFNPVKSCNCRANIFEGCGGSLKIGAETITIISEGMFSGANFSEVTIGRAGIEKNAFSNCNNLLSINIGNGVTYIAEEAFKGCKNIEQINVVGNSSFYASNSNSYNAIITKASPNTIILGCKNTSIPNNSNYPIIIGNYAFYDCIGLNSIDLSNHVTSIGEYAFSGCTGLVSVVFPEGCQVGNGAFSGCFGLSSISINGPATIGNGAFYGCTGLVSINISGPATIGSNAFYGCSGLASLAIDGTASIGDNAFSDCSNLASISFPITVAHELCNNSFNNTKWYNDQPDGILYLCGCCLGYKGTKPIGNISIIENTKSIAHCAFSNCTELAFVSFPNSMNCIYNNAFSGCTGLTSINLPSFVGDYAFSGCNGLTSISISIDYAKIGNYAFAGCTNISSVTIPNHMRSIGDYAFQNCTSLKEINFNAQDCWMNASNVWDGCSDVALKIDSVTRIKSSYWSGCDALSSISISNTISNIDNYAFSNCENLTTFIIGRSVRVIGSGAFANNPRLNMVYYNVEKDLEAPTNVFDNCPNLTTIHIGPDVQEIGSNIFKGCNSVHFVVALGPTPAVLDAGAFSDIVDNSMLMVSCGKRVTYYSVWNMFPFNNIIEDCNEYLISIGVNGTGGNVTSSATNAQMGQTIIITITPNSGMTLSSISVVNANDPTQIIPITPMGKSASNYSFVMPPFEVVVMATFTTANTSVEENTVVSVPASVYPNPTTGLVKVEAENIRHITISNMLGQIIYDVKATGDEFEYDFGKHGAGLYLIRIETANGMVVKKVSVR